MTDTPAEPDWSLLPHNPARFFGLEAGFDRRDLKQSYNQLIRRFKPERFPQEFQRIRAAYEQLENAIRYGQSPEVEAPIAESLEWISHPILGSDEPQVTPRSMASREPPTPLHERIKSGNVADIYRELESLAVKTPYDFYSLAVLSDVVDSQDHQQFVHWILKGLAEYPNEVGLLRILHSYFSETTDLSQCESLLLSCSRILREGNYFAVTEPFWRRLLRAQEFDRFRVALKQCEANLPGLHIDNRLSFYMQVLKPAIFLADREWINETYAFIEQNYDRIPSFLDYDLEILSRLRAYSNVRETFIQEDDTRQQLDRAMRDYFSEDQVTGDNRVLALQVSMAEEVGSLADAFSDFNNETYGPFYAVWLWVSYDVSERHIEPPKEAFDETAWHPIARKLIADMESRTRRSRLGTAWATRQVLYRSAQTAVYIGCVLGFCAIGVMIGATYIDWMGNRRGDDAVLAISVPIGVIVGLYLGYRLSKRIERRYWQPYTLRASADFYRRIWQRELVGFLARSQLSYQTFRSFIQSFANRSTTSAWICHYTDQDFTLPMFAIAHRFLA